MSYAQTQQFTQEQLKHPERFTAFYDSLFEVRTVGYYNPTWASGILLENGYASAEIQNPQKLTAITNRSQILAINFIFTAYPKNKEDWLTNYYSLLADRLANLFALKPQLNSTKVAYSMILQTDPENELEATRLFHGVEILYIDLNKVTTSSLADSAETPINTDARNMRYAPAMEYRDGTKEAVADAYQFLKVTRRLIHKDSTVIKALDRNDWKDAVVVVDWTASMYSYGIEALLYSLTNLGEGKISKFVLFNDGNKRKDQSKKVGNTGGIYEVNADDPIAVLKLMRKVANRGNGGDTEENDLEALELAMNKYASASHFILIADNKSCVRDFPLLTNLNKPVSIILCAARQVLNPQYLTIAHRLNGSIHTTTVDQNVKDALQPDGSYKINDDYFRLSISGYLYPVGYDGFRKCVKYSR